MYGLLTLTALALPSIAMEIEAYDPPGRTENSKPTSYSYQLCDGKPPSTNRTLWPAMGAAPLSFKTGDGDGVVTISVAYGNELKSSDFNDIQAPLNITSKPTGIYCQNELELTDAKDGANATIRIKTDDAEECIDIQISNKPPKRPVCANATGDSTDSTSSDKSTAYANSSSYAGPPSNGRNMPPPESGVSAQVTSCSSFLVAGFLVAVGGWLL